MRRILLRVRHEFLEVLPPTMFFFVGFCLLAVTKTLILREHGIQFLGFAKAAVGALLVGKTVLVADKFRFVDRFPDKPLIYNTLWKAGIYLLATIIVRYVEHLLPLLSEHGNVLHANQQLWHEIDWARFGVIHIWLSALIFVFCAVRELVRRVGRDEVLRMFFGFPSR